MPVMSELRHLTRVRICAPGRGACIGRIEDIRTPDDLPDIPGAWPQTGEFSPRQIVRDWGVSRVAMISYEPTAGQELVFMALEVAGEWYDLHRQHLMLEVIGQYEWPQPQPS
jgi:hypothetical protein